MINKILGKLRYTNKLTSYQKFASSVGIVKGLLIGLRQYEFRLDDAYEVDHVLYLGIFQVFITLRYE